MLSGPVDEGDVLTAIETPRLQLRPWRRGDAATLALILARNEARLLPWIPAHVATAVPEAALAERLSGFAADFEAQRHFRYAMVTRAGGQILGEASLFPRNQEGRCPLAGADRAEIGYWIDETAEGKGIVTEAAAALLAHAETLPGVRHVEIRCATANARSAAVPRRLGFRLASDDGSEQVWHQLLAR